MRSPVTWPLDGSTLRMASWSKLETQTPPLSTASPNGRRATRSLVTTLNGDLRWGGGAGGRLVWVCTAGVDLSFEPLATTAIRTPTGSSSAADAHSGTRRRPLLAPSGAVRASGSDGLRRARLRAGFGTALGAPASAPATAS